MSEEEFSKSCNEADLFVTQIRITPDKEIIRQRKSIVEHPFGTITRDMDAGRPQNIFSETEKVFVLFLLRTVRFGILWHGTPPKKINAQ
jgi:hypothetical protein